MSRGRKTKEYCKRGHKLSETRRRRKSGVAYCFKCRKERFKEKYIKKPRVRKIKPQITTDQKRKENRKVLLKYKYGLTIEDFNQMFFNQNGKCAICSLDLNTLYRHASVDHDHLTGKVRGLLCNKCNAGIGFLQDDVIIMNSAILYIQSFLDK